MQSRGIRHDHPIRMPVQRSLQVGFDRETGQVVIRQCGTPGAQQENVAMICIAAMIYIATQRYQVAQMAASDRT